MAEQNQKLTHGQLREALDGFSGTEDYHVLSPFHGHLVTTDGVKFLADKAGAYWLIDLIGSWQGKALRDEMLRDFQLWTLRRNGADHENPKGARATCWRDEGDEAFHQDIEFTDFPLAEIKLFVCPGEAGGRSVMVLMLPSEY